MIICIYIYNHIAHVYQRYVYAAFDRISYQIFTLSQPADRHTSSSLFNVSAYPPLSFGSTSWIKDLSIRSWDLTITGIYLMNRPAQMRIEPTTTDIL